MTRHVDRPPGQRADQRHVLRSLVGSALLARVVGGTDADQDAAHTLVAEVELDLLERALDQEGRVRVDDRTHALERHAGRGTDHERLADADVDRSARVALENAVRLEPADANVGEHDRDARIAVEQLLRLRGRSARACSRSPRRSAGFAGLAGLAGRADARS